MSQDLEKRAGRTSSGNIDEDYVQRLAEISNELLTSLYLFDRRRVWDIVITQIRKLFDCELVSLFWVDKDNPDYLVLEAQDPWMTSTKKLRLRIASEEGKGITGHAAKEGKTIILDQHDLENKPVRHRSTNHLLGVRNLPIRSFCTA